MDPNNPGKIDDVLHLLDRHLPPSSILASALTNKINYNSLQSVIESRKDIQGSIINSMANLEIYTSKYIENFRDTYPVTYIEITDNSKCDNVYRFIISPLPNDEIVYERLINKTYFSKMTEHTLVKMIPYLKLLIILKVYDMIMTVQQTNPKGMTTRYVPIKQNPTQESVQRDLNIEKEDDFIWRFCTESPQYDDEDEDEDEESRAVFVEVGNARKKVLDKLAKLIKRYLEGNITNSTIFSSNPIETINKKGGSSKTIHERTNRHVVLPGQSRKSVVYVKRGHEYVKVKGEFVTVKKAIADCASLTRLRHPKVIP